MSEPKVQDVDYIDFLVAHPTRVSATEAARCQPDYPDPPAHDAFTRLLHRLEPDSETLWNESRSQVRLADGLLILDDTTLDKPYSREIELVTYHWSGKHRAVVKGINLLTLLWTDGDRAVPCDYRLYDKADGKTKNDHFGGLIRAAVERGFHPECVCFDGWYASTENLKRIRDVNWMWLTRLKENRLVNPDRTGNRAVSACNISATGTVVHLKDYGMVKVFRIVAKDGSTDHWATNDLSMDDLTRLKRAEWSWRIEEYHRALKQHCGVEKAQVRAATAQRNHIGLSIRAFVRLESWCFHECVGWLEAKLAIIRSAVRRYINRPLYNSHLAGGTA